ncbi:MAG: hypothetical protein H0T76_02865 [Nannocystis sp.]|nr:hypothetical protein [Nannocystis sp.]MBA3545403.1 hypothetical protein [Nannocystis sp.]
MARRIALFTALAGFLSLDCKTTDPADTDAASSGGSSSGLTTVGPTTLTATSTGEPTTSGSSTGPGTTLGESSGSGSATATGTTDMTTGPVGPCKPIACSDGKTWACGDCIDNDGDGLVDLADIECISPCDDREDTFATGLPGDNMDPCKQDCFFDGNSGGGKGDCNWNLACDPMNPGGESCPYQEGKVCADTQSMECIETCNTPSGCDCFGCCTIAVDGKSYDIYLGDKDCSVDNIDNCRSCTKNDDCDDPCMPEMCELCFGETELPDGCDVPLCEGLDPCMIDKEGMSNCPEGTYCQTGCCQLLVPG